MLAAISLAVYQAVLIPLLCMGMPADWTDEEKLTQATIACIGLGVGEVIGGLLFGQIQDRFGTQIATKVNFFEWILACIALLAYTLHNTYSFESAFTVALLWGVQDCSLNSFQFTVCGKQFEQLTTAFAIYYWFKSVFGFICICLESLMTTTEAYMIYLSVVTAFGAFAWLLFMFGFELK